MMRSRPAGATSGPTRHDRYGTNHQARGLDSGRGKRMGGVNRRHRWRVPDKGPGTIVSMMKGTAIKGDSGRRKRE